MPTSRFRPWLLLAGPLLVIAAVLLYPIARVSVLSFQRYNLRQVISGKPEFIGLDNFKEVFSGAPGLPSSFLWQTVLPNTVVFAILAVVATVVVGTLVALLLQTLGPVARALVIGAALIAWAMPAFTGTYIWQWIFDPDSGIARDLLVNLGIIGQSGHNWFTDRWSFYAIVLLNVVHHSFPFVAVTIFAGLLTVPEELHEAAKVDGASAWRRFWSITMPLLRPVFAVVTILSTIWDFKVFTQVYLMPAGDGSNPNMFNLGVWSYISAIKQNQYGFGAAIAVLLTLVLLLITLVYLRLLFKEEEL